MEKIRKQVRELEGNIQGQRMLRLESAPVLTTNLDKGKGVVMEFPKKNQAGFVGEKLLSAAIKAGAKAHQVAEGCGRTDMSAQQASFNYGSMVIVLVSFLLARPGPRFQEKT